MGPWDGGAVGRWGGHQVRRRDRPPSYSSAALCAASRSAHSSSSKANRAAGNRSVSSSSTWAARA
ncbi:MAG: hypothetical protein DYH08_15840 [Actinobacteria bacterium ATB1]|nr:hypothetical protein [Actinobacteria bacterium ATB1]